MEQGLRNAVRVFLGLLVLLLLSLSELDSAEAGGPIGHTEAAAAIRTHDKIDFIEIQDVVVSEILPDDLTGRPHQRWKVKLSTGEEILAVFNSDTGERVPLDVGDVMTVAGEFLVARHEGPIIHWLHTDPRGRRPNGFVEMDGQRYGEKGWDRERRLISLDLGLEIDEDSIY